MFEKVVVYLGKYSKFVGIYAVFYILATIFSFYGLQTDNILLVWFGLIIAALGKLVVLFIIVTPEIILIFRRRFRSKKIEENLN
ncbi:MAG: hypothetical protein IH840_09985 [Candidatus Heimdallarchaeota archaeon]|nr:hypothetical protein [Candidatus Heimdallarchaeota archaeon]